MTETVWHAIVACDPIFDGQYYYGVVTTGIFCRPSCRSRTPQPHNVRLFGTVTAARTAGFRPCKRCRPEDTHSPDARLVDLAKTIVTQRYREPLTLHTLAQELAVSPSHLHRTFKRVTGVTPAEYLLGARLNAVEALQDPSRSITDIAHAIGFGSSAHFATLFKRSMGCTPSCFRTMHARENGRVPCQISPRR